MGIIGLKPPKSLPVGPSSGIMPSAGPGAGIGPNLGARSAVNSQTEFPALLEVHTLSRSHSVSCSDGGQQGLQRSHRVCMLVTELDLV